MSGSLFGRPRTCTKAMNEFERKDDLDIRGLHIWQDKREFCFGVDAVLLSAFCEVRKGDRVLDLCSGNGIVPILLAGKTEAGSITGLEINPVQTALARRSFAENGLSHVKMVDGDVKDAKTIFSGLEFDVISVNPPYIKDGRMQNPNRGKAIARHEVLCTLSDVLQSAASLLRYGGRFYMVHRPDRLTDILDEMRAFKIEPKRLRTVHTKRDGEAKLVLVEGALGGGTFLHIMPPLIIYNDDGTYTEELMSQYGRDTK